MGFFSHHLGRLSVGRKLLLIFLLDMSAVAYISGILVHEKFIAIDFARMVKFQPPEDLVNLGRWLKAMRARPSASAGT